VVVEEHCKWIRSPGVCPLLSVVKIVKKCRVDRCIRLSSYNSPNHIDRQSDFVGSRTICEAYNTRYAIHLRWIADPVSSVGNWILENKDSSWPMRLAECEDTDFESIVVWILKIAPVENRMFDVCPQNITIFLSHRHINNMSMFCPNG